MLIIFMNIFHRIFSIEYIWYVYILAILILDVTDGGGGVVVVTVSKYENIIKTLIHVSFMFKFSS